MVHFNLYRVVFLMLIVALSGSVAALSGSVAANFCNKKPMLFLMGDSNSDTGGFNNFMGKLDNLPYGRIFPTKPNGRASDGKLVIDFLCENLKATYLTPYLAPYLAQPNFNNGLNFAISGARTEKTSTLSLQVQTNQLIRLQNVSAELQSQGFNGLIDAEDFKNALYIIDIGQNDLSPGNYTEIPTFVSNIREAITSVYEIGGRNIWVHNTGPLGCLPLFVNFHHSNSSSDYDRYGCVKDLNKYAKHFNSLLDHVCETMRNTLKDATIVFVDIYKIKYEMIAHAASYGFENPLKACYEPYRGNGTTACEQGSRYISWDGVHYTEAANSLVASQIMSNKFSKPPLPLTFFCNN